MKRYEIYKELLGVGEFGKVFKAKRLYTKENWQQSSENITEFVAIKSISKAKMDKVQLKQIQEEIKILTTLDHPNIVKYFDEYENEKYMYLVIEYCSGGDLFDYI